MQPTQTYIRCFDLGGSGLKTALVSYDEKKGMRIEGKVHQLGKCPDDKKVSEWVREKLKEIASIDLDREVDKDYLFGFSLAGLDKLRSKPVNNSHIPTLFALPEEKVGSAGDGSAHLLASLKTVENLPEGRVWNIALGTGVGFGFTNSKKEIKPSKDLNKFFDTEAWEAKEPVTNKSIWKVGSAKAYDELVTQYDVKTADTKFAERWSAFITKRIIEPSTASDKDWGNPQAIVFTGGHIEHRGDILVQNLEKSLGVSVFKGPKQAGIIGAAWLALKQSH